MLTREETWLLREKYHGQKTKGFLTDCQHLKAGEPLAYVIGYINFLHCKIWLDTKPLIPRVETEFWVEQLIRKIKKDKSTSPLRILDLCAGSGCIGIAITKAIPKTEVDFIELDSAHIPTIKKNCQENNITKGQTRIMAANLLENLRPKERYDFIISNPPYINPKLDRTEPSVKNFEPSLALYGGEAGLDIITEIIKTAPVHLKDGGELWLEHEPEQTKAILALGDTKFIITTFKDQYHVDRFSQLILR